ncbi:MAG TPA: hypothetical protein VFW75_16875, partial [Acetobacteraceae bacterium]|nr:hypothetical protein [Acetobacteraceae bacterium]
KITTLQRTATAVIQILSGRPDARNRSRYSGGISREDAFAEARAVRIIAAGLLSAAEAAIDANRPEPPADQHYHTPHHPIARPTRAPDTGGVRV